MRSDHTRSTCRYRPRSCARTSKNATRMHTRPVGVAPRDRSASGLWGPAAPLGPVVAALVPRFALLPAPTPRLMGLRPMCTVQIPNRLVPPRIGGWSTLRARRFGVDRICLGRVPAADSTYAGGGGGEECEARHER